MFVISLSNQYVVRNGEFVEWSTQAEAEQAAISLNAEHGLNAYVHPADRRDRTVFAATAMSFGYSED